MNEMKGMKIEVFPDGRIKVERTVTINDEEYKIIGLGNTIGEANDNINDTIERLKNEYKKEGN
ncbi:MAG: hypothetical protein GX088_08270 [Clostridia bacterium]|nr:hypothetical protein [Clostridia bacterium]